MYDVIHAWFSSLASTVHRYQNNIFYLLYILVANIPVPRKEQLMPHLNGGRPHLPALHHWYQVHVLEPAVVPVLLGPVQISRGSFWVQQRFS